MTHCMPSGPCLRQARTWRVQALVALAGALVAIAHVLCGPPLVHGTSLSLVPTIIMIVTLLAGWRGAVLCGAGVFALLAAMTDSPWWQTVVPIAGAVLCGEALRRGIAPALMAIMLLLVMLATSLQPLAAGSAAGSFAVAADAVVQAGMNAALATAALVAMPRRSGALAWRCRTRWDHLLFVLIVGSVSITSLGLLAHYPGGSTAGSNDDWQPTVAVRLAVLFALAVASSCMLARWFGVATRQLSGMGRGHEASDRATRRRELPLEALSALADFRRLAGRLERRTRRGDLHLTQLRQACLQMRSELRHTGETLRQRTQALQQAADAQADAQARCRILMESTPDVAVFVDGRGVIESAGGPAAALLGYQPMELAGKPLRVLIPPDWILPHALDIPDATEPDRRPGTGEGPVRTADGSDREAIIQLQRFLVGEAGHYLVRLRESGRMKQGLSTLEQTRELARSLNHSQDLFIATMSHELRTPLHGLIATLDMMRIDANSGSEFRHQLSIARSSARALLKIANDVLDLTRIKSSLFTLERVPFSMSRILREVVDEASARAASLGLALSLKMVPELPTAFIGDPGRLKQILANLVSNALKFTASGGATLEVHYDGRTCTVDVSDTGGGIPPDKREVIFDPFVQLESRPARRIGGSGLGLPISRRLAMAMRGNLLLLESGPRGSTFRLTLPFEASDEPPPEDQSQRILSNPHGRILVVEDNPANRYVAQALLASLKCPATIVESGGEALAALRQQEFDLILMDCQMPGLDGYETTRRARALLRRRVPIIAMTANAMAEDRNHCIEAGMDDYLPKPFNRLALNAILCKWLVPGASAEVGTASLDARIGMHPDLDTAALDELRESLQWRRGPMERIRASFRDSVERVLPLLDNPGSDRTSLQRQLHTLLGSAGMVGARQVEYLIGQMQRAVKADRLQALEGAAELLRRALRRYERDFERRLAMGAGTDQVERLLP